jgi:uncharacterized integral membrane protein (TIGR00697 family)
MSSNIVHHKASRLFLILGGFFLANVFAAEFVGVKIFSLESSLGFQKFSFSFFGYEGLSMDLTAGVLLWPVVFIMTDVINEYYGRRGVRFLSFLAVGLIMYVFLMFYLGIRVIPADWWIGSKESDGVPDMQIAFSAIYGQGLWIIIGSLIAFLIGQVVDVTVFHRIKRFTGEKKIWLRATGSTVVSQFIDSYVVLLVAFYLGADWDLRLVLAIGTVNICSSQLDRSLPGT